MLLNKCFSSESWTKVLMGVCVIFHKKVHIKCFQVTYRTMAFPKEQWLSG